MNDQNRRIVKNTVAQYCRIIITAILAILSSRYILQGLGIDSYGVFSVVAGFISLFGFLNNSLLVAVQRFISYEIPTSNRDNINKIYNTSSFIHIVLACIILLLGETLGLYFIKHQMTFPSGQLDNAIIVFQCVMVSFIFNIISIPQQAVLVAYEKIQVFSIIGIVESVLKFICALTLKYYTGNKLVYYAVIFLVISISIRILYTVIVQLNFRFLKNKFRPDKAYLQQLSHFASWNTFGAVANLGKVQGVNVLLNMFFGTAVNAAYGLANQLNSQFVFFHSSIFQAANSQVIQAYRNNDKERLTTLVDQTTKYAFLLYAIATITVFVTSHDLLFLWLDDVPEYCNVFVRLMIINSAIELFSTPLMFIVQASGKIKNYFILISVILLLILPFSYIALRLGCDPQVVLVITIFINILALFIRLLYSSKVVNYDAKGYLVRVIIPSFVVILLLLPISSIYTQIPGLAVRLLVGVTTVPALVIVMSWFILFNEIERRYLLNYAKDFIKKCFRGK